MTYSRLVNEKILWKERETFCAIEQLFTADRSTRRSYDRDTNIPSDSIIDVHQNEEASHMKQTVRFRWIEKSMTFELGMETSCKRAREIRSSQIEFLIDDDISRKRNRNSFGSKTTTQVEWYGDERSVLLYAEIRAVISLKWPVIRPYYVTIRWSYTGTFWHTAVENHIPTVHGRIAVYFNDITVSISAYDNTERIRTRIRPVLFVLGSLRIAVWTSSDWK